MGKGEDVFYIEFVKFSLFLFSKVGICNLQIKEAVSLLNNFFEKRPDLDLKFKELLVTLLVEWDNSLYEICDLIEYLYKANNFEELRGFILENPELRDTFLN